MAKDRGPETKDQRPMTGDEGRDRSRSGAFVFRPWSFVHPHSAGLASVWIFGSDSRQLMSERPSFWRRCSAGMPLR